VIANVQSALQQQGYYQGDIDGILGPETRAALAEYQTAQGIEPTGAVDEPTLETLGMA
jgi:peptidoglycan hydrolase-like protein with peptidoglycan-binding domain